MGLIRKRIFYFLFVVIALAPRVTIAQNLGVDILKDINPMYPNSQYWVQTSASAFWVSGILSFGSLGYGILKNNEKLKYNGCEMLISIGAGALVTEILKITVNRERPADKYPTEIFVLTPTHGGSFPSGHTSLAFSTATTLALEYRKWYIVVPAFLWAGSVGYSRMYLGKHYPGDVLAGAIIGIGSGYFSHWLTKKMFNNKHVHDVQPD
jgi:membrane-associated phospholipid phosphatase